MSIPIRPFYLLQSFNLALHCIHKSLSHNLIDFQQTVCFGFIFIRIKDSRSVQVNSLSCCKHLNVIPLLLVFGLL